MGWDISFLAEAVHAVIEDTANALRLEEARQKTTLLQKFNGHKWLARLPFQVSWAALELLDHAINQALRIHKKEVPRGNCTASTCDCPISTQHGLLCASVIADKIEAGVDFEREGNLSIEN
jgi:hypothetical protein